MKKLLSGLAVLFIFSNANAADDIIYLPIDKALQEARENGLIDASIEFKFGSKSGSKDKIIAKNLMTNKKSNKVGKDAEVSCTRAFHSALIQFQQAAIKNGGKKVVNLTGYFKKIPYDSPTMFQCGVGSIMSGVTLRGDIAQ
ncbi:MAG: excinuclease ABC subunit A [Helicobacter sp.]|nr:excinuclease ABC subunit A [Helicobacter sp.]